MKTTLLIALIFSMSMTLQAQTSELQSEWLQKVTDQQAVDEIISSNGYLYYSEELISNTDRGDTDVIMDLKQKVHDYRESNSYLNNSGSKMTVGSYIQEEDTFFILSGWRDFGSGWKKEVDVVFRDDLSQGISLDIERNLDKERTMWEEKANAHDPLAHTQYSYAEDAVYFSGGRRNDGPEGIAQRYSYMENPGYSVYLEDIFLKRISEDKVVEIGRYSIGSRDSRGKGMYLIVWERQTNDRWQIALDFNF